MHVLVSIVALNVTGCADPQEVQRKQQMGGLGH